MLLIAHFQPGPKVMFGSKKKDLHIEVDDKEEEDGQALVKSPVGKGIAYRYPTRRESLQGMGAFIVTSPQPTPTHGDQQPVTSEDTGASGEGAGTPSGKRPSFLQGKASPQNATPSVVKQIEEVSFMTTQRVTFS